MARNWLTRLAEAEGRRNRIDAHFSGDPGSGLSVDQQWHEIEASLRGIAPWQALDLLEDANDEELEGFIQRGLIGSLNNAPADRELHERVESFRAKRLPGDQQMRPYVPGRLFGPEMINPRLANLGVRRDLTPQELEELGAEIAGRTRTAIAAGLPLNQRRQRAVFDRWWNEVGELAVLVNRVQEYLDGSLDVVEDDNDLRLLISKLLGSEYTLRHALDLLEAIDDAQLARLFEDDAATAGPRGSWLRALLEQAIPPQAELRPRLETLLSDRFNDADRVRIDVPLPPRFSPGMVSDELADVGIRDELTPEQLMVAATALAAGTARPLLALPPVELARARRWMLGVRKAMVDWVLGYVRGKKGYGMTAMQMRSLVKWLLTDPIPDPERAPRAVLKLLESVDDVQLAGLFEDDDQLAGLRGLLEQAIPPSHDLHPRLEDLFRDRLDEAGEVKTDVHPALPFSLGLISEDLDFYDESAVAQLRPGMVEYAGLVLKRMYAEVEGYTSGVSDRLAKLSPQQQAEAMSALARLRVKLYDNELAEGSPRPELLGHVRALDEMLGRLWADAARRIRDASDLEDLTATPPASQAEQLLEALTPASRPKARRPSRRALRRNSGARTSVTGCARHSWKISMKIIGIRCAGKVQWSGPNQETCTRGTTSRR